MTRPYRLPATLVVVAALAFGAVFSFVRADADAAVTATPPAQAGAPSAAPAASAPLAYGGPGLPGQRPAPRGSELPGLKVFSRALWQMHDTYVDRSRFDARKMLVAALEAVEKTVAEVMVTGDASSDKLQLTVGKAHRELDISGVKKDDVYSMGEPIHEAMDFIQANLVAHKDMSEIEYAAANGMLQTLDPHSVMMEPKLYKEMKLQTRGEFGGVGFVITMRDGKLTVVKVLKNTPAQRAGIKARDVVTKIEELSTINMDLQDAVDRLRGQPRSYVSLTVQRGDTEPRRIRIRRDVINVETVSQAQLLNGNVGYVRLSQFSGNTARDLYEAIQAQTAQAGGKLSGLVLDLRNNPGGLLEQAVQVSDLFLSHGVIVKTVGSGHAQNINEVREAESDRSDLTDLPLVVITNNGSASASEIVAGALKNNDRALVIGRQTFGKGSVQVLYEYPDLAQKGDPAALKLTIAQYFTPGDVSIQETGITPDVLLLPGRAVKEQISYFAPPRTMGEVDLDAHLTNPAGKPVAPDAPKPKRVEQAALELRYLLEDKPEAQAKAAKTKDAAKEAPPDHASLEITPEQQEDEDSEADPDKFVEDYQIKFANELLRGAPQAIDRPKLLTAAEKLVGERAEQEKGRLEQRLHELGVDWSQGKPGNGAPRAVVSVTPPASKDLTAGDTMSWTVTVDNRGNAPFRRLRAWSSSDSNPELDRREFVFGTIRPGEKRSWTVPVKLPKGLTTRRDEVTFHFDDDGAKAPADVTTTVAVDELARPAFAFSVQVDDRAGGNGDGLPQRGETFTLRVNVRNAGAGPSGDKTFVQLKNLGDEKLFITKGREVLGTLKSGESRSASMEVELRTGSKSEELPIQIAVVDPQMFEVVQEKLDLPVAKPAPKVPPAQGQVRVERADLAVRGGADAKAPVVAVAAKGTVLPVTGNDGDFVRVEWTKGRFGFVPAADVKSLTAPAKAGSAQAAWQREPPRITLAPDPAHGLPIVEGDTWKLSGSAVVPSSADPDARLRDVYVMVNDQKVFFRVQPDDATTQQLDFTADLPLKPGVNNVMIVAREDEDFFSRRDLVIYRRPAPAVAQDGRKGESASAQQ